MTIKIRNNRFVFVPLKMKPRNSPNIILLSQFYKFLTKWLEFWQLKIYTFCNEITKHLNKSNNEI
jgi:hypothetical protein